MERIYFDDPTGLKESRLADLQVENPEELFGKCREFLCSHLIEASPERTFFGQNITEHVANVATLVRNTNPALTTVVMSDHEMRWMKEMFEKSGHQADSTYSNYHTNHPVDTPTFKVKVSVFSSFADVIRETTGPTIFLVSHVSRLTGETQDIELLCQLVRAQHPESVLIIDGAQSLGVTRPVNVQKSCDVYIGTSSKFIGAEPNVGFAFFAEDFFKKYRVQDNYPEFDSTDYDKDLYSLWESLQNPLFNNDYNSDIIALKEYAVQRVSEAVPGCLFIAPNQSPGFLTLDFGSKKANEQFVAYAAEHNVIISDNTNETWSIVPAPRPLVRVGISIHTTKDGINTLIELALKKESL